MNMDMMDLYEWILDRHIQFRRNEYMVEWREPNYDNYRWIMWPISLSVRSFIGRYVI